MNLLTIPRDWQAGADCVVLGLALALRAGAREQELARGVRGAAVVGRLAGVAS